MDSFINHRLKFILEYFENEPILTDRNLDGIWFCRCWLPSEHDPQLSFIGSGNTFEDALDMLYRKTKEHKQNNS